MGITKLKSNEKEVGNSIMDTQINKTVTDKAYDPKKLRTKAEMHLWYDFLQCLPVTVYKNKVIGRYTVDFYIPSVKMVIEIYDSQNHGDEQIKRESERDDYFRYLKTKVARYSYLDIIENFPNVCTDVVRNITAPYTETPSVRS